MPMGTYRTLTRAAAVTAASTPPPPAGAATLANCADPEKTTREQTTGASPPQPWAWAVAPKLTASRNEAVASPDPALRPARKPSHGTAAPRRSELIMR